MKERHVHKSEIDIKRMLKQIRSGFIDDWHWAKIVERMYETSDCLVLEEMFHHTVRMRIESGFSDDGAMGKGKLSREEKLTLLSSKDSKKLMFSEFVKCVLDFQLGEHERFIDPFRKIFK